MRIKVAIFVSVAFLAAMLGVDARSTHPDGTTGAARAARGSFQKQIAEAFRGLPYDCATVNALQAASGVEGHLIARTTELRAAIAESGFAHRDVKKLKTKISAVLKKLKVFLEASARTVADIQADVGACPPSATRTISNHRAVTVAPTAAFAPTAPDPEFESIFGALVTDINTDFIMITTVLPSSLTAFFEQFFGPIFSAIFGVVCGIGAYGSVTCGVATPSPAPTPIPTPEPTPIPTPTSTPINLPPVVSAGPDREIDGLATEIHGTATDSTLPNGPLVFLWEKVSGPGTVTFDIPTALDTHVSFSEGGTYVLRLTADDGQYTDSDVMTIVVAE